MTHTPTVGNSLTSLRSWGLSHTLSNSLTPTVGIGLNKSNTLAPQAALSLSLSKPLTPTVGNSLSLNMTLAPQAALSLTNSITMTPTVGNSLSNHMFKSRSSCVYSGKY